MICWAPSSFGGFCIFSDKQLNGLISNLVSELLRLLAWACSILVMLCCIPDLISPDPGLNFLRWLVVHTTCCHNMTFGNSTMGKGIFQIVMLFLCGKYDEGIVLKIVINVQHMHQLSFHDIAVIFALLLVTRLVTSGRYLDQYCRR